MSLDLEKEHKNCLASDLVFNFGSGNLPRFLDIYPYVIYKATIIQFLAEVLGKLGYANVVNLSGGWQSWEKAGYPVE